MVHRTWSDVVYWIAPYALLNMLSYRTKDHQPKEVITHSSLSPHTFITN